MQSNLNTIDIPAIGVNVQVRIAAAATGNKATLIETSDEPGYGPPMHRHERETEIFHVLTGQYLFEVDGERTIASAGETVVGHAGSTHRFTNIDKETSRMLVLITPGLDAAAFFNQLRSVMANGEPQPDALRNFGAKWGVEFLGPPLKA
ncbi:cupin domain-containing protein [Burkholderia sp. S171]|jgi:quercetin dioxygenase-like cupin family protein|uniref:cupin domain-containing protein n=1 Tax=Burkholderia sp. S171 TaxID=1641860 RepID=UPI00131C0F24|nr:cupin domain-containing protein [Burkholderia sp. S171]